MSYEYRDKIVFAVEKSRLKICLPSNCLIQTSKQIGPDECKMRTGCCNKSKDGYCRTCGRMGPPLEDTLRFPDKLARDWEECDLAIPQFSSSCYQITYLPLFCIPAPTIRSFFRFADNHVTQYLQPLTFFPINLVTCDLFGRDAIVGSELGPYGIHLPQLGSRLIW